VLLALLVAEESGEEPVDGLPGRPRLHRLNPEANQRRSRLHLEYNATMELRSVAVVYSVVCYFLSQIICLFFISENFRLPF
jgi:hypothetical protein